LITKSISSSSGNPNFLISSKLAIQKLLEMEREKAKQGIKEKSMKKLHEECSYAKLELGKLQQKLAYQFCGRLGERRCKREKPKTKRIKLYFLIGCLLDKKLSPTLLGFKKALTCPVHQNLFCLVHACILATLVIELVLFFLFCVQVLF
jgi:hypothetical protein